MNKNRALRIVFIDKYATFNELLQRDGSVTIHGRYIQALETETFRVFNGISPHKVKNVFPLKKTNIYCSKFTFKCVMRGQSHMGHLLISSKGKQKQQQARNPP